MKPERNKALLDAAKAMCRCCADVGKSAFFEIGPAKFEEWEEFNSVAGHKVTYSGWRHLMKHEYGQYPYSIRCGAGPIHDLIAKENK